MTDYRRDALLAACCGVVLLGVLVVAGWTRALLDPVAVVVGVPGALVVEAAFLADTPAADLWERRWVRAASVLAVLAGAVAGGVFAGPLVVAAACWGLATYFALLALVLMGIWP